MGRKVTMTFEVGDDGVLEIDASEVFAVRLVKGDKSVASSIDHLMEQLEWLVRFVDCDTRITTNGVEERICE